ncbi:MAG: STAS domain-containing protein [Ruminococcaceae bacterium]|nr:STAS domain-containing protein [Oscillospiraceae bacterium]
MSVEINVTGEVVTAYLKGEIDHHTAREMRETIDSAVELNMPSLLVLDFGGVTFMDSSGIGLCLGRYRNLLKSGAELHITSASPNIYKVMRLAGLEKLAKLSKEKTNENNK